MLWSFHGLIHIWREVGELWHLSVFACMDCGIVGELFGVKVLDYEARVQNPTKRW